MLNLCRELKWGDVTEAMDGTLTWVVRRGLSGNIKAKIGMTKGAGHLTVRRKDISGRDAKIRQAGMINWKTGSLECKKERRAEGGDYRHRQSWDPLGPHRPAEELGFYSRWEREEPEGFKQKSNLVNVLERPFWLLLENGLWERQVVPGGKRCWQLVLVGSIGSGER